MIEPLGYLDMIMLISNCSLVITDSGGLQKEAFFFKKYCITLRDETEWIELVNGGYNTLAGAQKDKIIEEVSLASGKNVDFNKPIYGTGDACGKIVENLTNSLPNNWQ
jgi:UDP-GlcNAc3NAcA epimerase